MSTSLYDRDFYLWIQSTTKLLKEKQFDQLDLDNLVEEIESMGRSEKRELYNRLIVLMLHILKWKYQPNKRSDSWKSIINEQKRQIESLLLDSPSLNNYLKEIFDKCYKKAKKEAAEETNLNLSTFPEDNIFSISDVLNFDFSES